MGCREAALEYAGKGWAVLPLHTVDDSGACSCRKGANCGSAGKHPLTAQGVNDASTDQHTVEGWWERWPEANVGIATGRASGLVVFDCDAPEAAQTLEDLDLPVTLRARTGRSYHAYYACDESVPNSVGRLAEKLDVRGDGGFVVAPPSRHASGKVYQWDNDLEPAVPPAGVLYMLNGGTGGHGVTTSLAELMESAPQGEHSGRNQWLIKVAGHYANTASTWRQCARAIRQANWKLECPLSSKEIESTVLVTARKWFEQEDLPLEGSPKERLTKGWELHSLIVGGVVWGARSDSPADVWLADGTELHFDNVGRQLLNVRTLCAELAVQTQGRTQGPLKAKQIDLLRAYQALMELSRVQEAHDERAEVDEWVQSFLTSTGGLCITDLTFGTGDHTDERYKALCAFHAARYDPRGGTEPPRIMIDRITGERFFKARDLGAYVFHAHGQALTPGALKARMQRAGYDHRVVDGWPQGYGRESRREDRGARRRMALYVVAAERGNA